MEEGWGSHGPVILPPLLTNRSWGAPEETWTLIGLINISCSQSAFREPWILQDGPQGQSQFITICYWPCDSCVYSGVFQRLHCVGCPDTVGMQACIFLFFKIFSALISPKVCIGKYSLHKLILFRVANTFGKSSWNPEVWEWLNLPHIFACAIILYIHIYLYLHLYDDSYFWRKFFSR